MTYQNLTGAIQIRGRSVSNQKVANTTASFPAATELVWFARFRSIAITDTNTDWLFRVGTTNTPPFGFRGRNNQATPDHVIYFDSTASGGGRPSIEIEGLATDTEFAIVVHWAAAGLSQVDHPDTSAGDKCVVYVYDLSTRTPTATVYTSADSDLAFALDTDTGWEWGSSTGLTDYDFENFGLKYITSSTTGFTKVMADQLGQYARDLTKIGMTWSHAYACALSDDAVISASPTGREAWHLQDLISTEDLTPSGTTLPSWTTSSIRQALPTSEDTVQLIDWGVSSTRGMSNLHQTLDQNEILLVMAGDSLNRIDLQARMSSQFIAKMIANGYTLGGFFAYTRTSLLPVKATLPSMTDFTETWYCNAAMNSSYITIQEPSSSDRYGVPCGGIVGFVAGSSPVLGTNNKILNYEITNDYMGQELFQDGTRLKARVTVFYSTNVNQYADVVRFVGDASTVDLDLSATDEARQHPQDASFATLASTAGDFVEDRLCAAHVLVDLGTSGTTRNIEVRLPNGVSTGDVLYIGPPMILICDASGNPLTGAGVFRFMSVGDNSVEFTDLYASQTCTADGQKHSTDDRLGRYLGLAVDSASTKIVYVQNLQTESTSESNVETRCGLLKTRWDGMAGDMGLGSPFYLLISQQANNVDKDSVVADRQHGIDWRNAYTDFADANPDDVAHWSVLDWTRGFLLTDTENVWDASSGYDDYGIGEAAEVEADAALLAKIGGSATVLDSQILHPTSSTFTAAAMGELFTEILAAVYLVGGSIFAKFVPAIHRPRRF